MIFCTSTLKAKRLTFVGLPSKIVCDGGQAARQQRNLGFVLEDILLVGFKTGVLFFDLQARATSEIAVADLSILENT